MLLIKIINHKVVAQLKKNGPKCLYIMIINKLLLKNDFQYFKLNPKICNIYI